MPGMRLVRRGARSPSTTRPFAPRILKSPEEHEAALAYIAELMDAAPGSEEMEALELWSLLVERYEEEHFPIDTPDPVDAIKFRMEQEGLRQKDLEKYFQGKNRVSEILNRKRTLSIGMIRALHRGLGIPAEVLLREVPA
jgi:HTH-type transcriptional regulator/antitoxin HigA